MIILSQSDLDKIISDFPWHDSFVREAHVLSPSYVKRDGSGVVAFNSPWLFRVLVSSLDSNNPGIEFIFKDTDRVVLTSFVDLSPCGKVSENKIEMTFTDSDSTPILARGLEVNILDSSSWGYKTQYCVFDMFDEGGFYL